MGRDTNTQTQASPYKQLRSTVSPTLARPPDTLGRLDRYANGLHLPDAVQLITWQALDWRVRRIDYWCAVQICKIRAIAVWVESVAESPAREGNRNGPVAAGFVVGHIESLIGLGVGIAEDEFHAEVIGAPVPGRNGHGPVLS